MGDASLWNPIPRRVAAAWRTIQSVLDPAAPDAAARTTLTFRAVADAVVPRTPDLGDELGREHVPGGRAVGLGDFLAVYVNDLFQFGLPGLGNRAESAWPNCSTPRPPTRPGAPTRPGRSRRSPKRTGSGRSAASTSSGWSYGRPTVNRSSSTRGWSASSSSGSPR
ncbi:hypothetical protein BRC93_11540 [Halobacteriales archaeon QS_5_70_15]|nr:MAG: hypothetical protein BRC93_11540 [Halobacteriales archaeon QS_5_70_15]